MRFRLIVMLAVALMSGPQLAPAAESAAADGVAQRLAVLEISQLPITYAWAVDAKDIDLLMSVFSDDIVYDLSAYGFPPAVGKDAVRETFLHGIFEYVECSFISISNIQVSVDGDTATGRDYFVHAGYNPRNQPKNTRSHTEGRHFFESTKQSGQWKISFMRGEPFYERWERFDPEGLRHCAPRSDGRDAR